MKEIKVQAPAKINLTLEITGRRDDGYHDIKSIMHAISLYDYLTVKIEDAEGINIELSGNSSEIPYDNKNLVWKAAEKFFEATGINNVKLSVFIEKNIPVQAGLAGGSTDAAGILFALNVLYDKILSDEKINEICASLGSDLNFCLKGGCAVCTSRGEKIRPLPFLEFGVSIVKPRYRFISAKEAFETYDLFEDNEFLNATDDLIPLILRGNFHGKYLHNDLQKPLENKYNYISNMAYYIKNSKMSGSGPTFYVLQDNFQIDFAEDEFICIENLHTISHGVRIVK